MEGVDLSFHFEMADLVNATQALVTEGRALAVLRMAFAGPLLHTAIVEGAQTTGNPRVGS